MSLDSFIDAIQHRFRRQMAPAHPQRNDQPPAISGVQGQPAGTTSQHIHDSFNIHGSFNNIQNFVFNNATAVETMNYINHTISRGAAVLELLGPYTRPDAVMDSSARYPPPTCHPETRLSVRGKLGSWLYNPKRKWRMIWLHGPAGTGKSAVAQTFAEQCAKWKRLGGAYFFSRTSKRNKPQTVVPSLVYQLAVNIPEYKAIITTELASDPQLLEKAPPVQFRRLIIEPFSTLQRQSAREPIVIILDGLDECEGADAQLMILDMITEVIRVNQQLPLLWLICSRPEVHLKLAFSRMTDCGREELVIDATCREDVERYLRGGIGEIKTQYADVTPLHWPSEAQLKKLVDSVSGLFVLASTILGYIGDLTCADPVGQLDDVTAYLESVQAVGSRNPLVSLDLLYLRILGDIPPQVFPTTWRILAYLIHAPLFRPQFLPQVLCNFARLDQHTFYRALRGLHSVIEVPEPGDAIELELRFHHTSFVDFLRNPNRSGKFVIEGQEALVDFAKLTLAWYDVDLEHFHTNDGWHFDYDHKHDTLPGLTWVSAGNEQYISSRIADFARRDCWFTISQISWANVDEDLLSRIYDFDFRYCPAHHLNHLANWFRKQDPLNTFVRTESSSPTDFRLFEYFNLMIKNGVAEPATFPLRGQLWTRQYYFIGHGIKSAIVWGTTAHNTGTVHALNGDGAPSEAQLSKYQKFLDDIGWREEDAKKHFESRTNDGGKRGLEKKE